MSVIKASGFAPDRISRTSPTRVRIERTVTRICLLFNPRNNERRAGLEKNPALCVPIRNEDVSFLFVVMSTKL